jgi:H+-translocating NAD(P) transhydrogenase subunit alpha
MRIGVPTETAAGERRVALVPESVGRLVRSGLEVVVQRGAGSRAYFLDAAYADAGATLLDTPEEVFEKADLVAKVAKLSTSEVELVRPGAIVVSLLQPGTSLDLLTRLVERGLTALSLELIPRIARAQSMDVLSSQSSLSGYKAALIAAASLGKFFPMMMTAAGTIPPARVLVMGTGVAGLQAIATARRLGAVVQGYDIRAAAKEQVESLGATFVSPQVSGDTETKGGYAKELSADAQEREQQVVHGIVAAADVVITTALIPGRPAPRLVPASMVAAMQPGSVIVDIAAEMGGNCELTEPGATVTRHDVVIHGPVNLPSTMPLHASQLYSRNVFNLLQHLIRDTEVVLDLEDVITRDCCVTHQGEVRHQPSRSLVATAAPTTTNRG